MKSGLLSSQLEKRHGIVMATASVAHRSEETEDLSPEDQARAAIYGLVSNLFYVAPSKDLLAVIAQARNDIAGQAADSELIRAWRDLQQAAAAADESAVRQEYDETFAAPGRAKVVLYGSYHLTGALRGNPVVELRDQLAKLGLARRIERGENEDHISALCDVMRLLIQGADGVSPAPIATQREFFMTNLAPWYPKLHASIMAEESADFYRKVAALASSFFRIEAQSFEMA